jgi:hypothetical protein
MDRDNSKSTIFSVYLISSILALTIIVETTIHITPVLAQTTGSYIDISRIINIPKNMPNSSTLTDNNANLTGNDANLTSGTGNLTEAP